MLLLLLACVNAPDAGDPKDDTAAEPEVPSDVEDLTVDLTVVPTVVRVRWRTEVPSRATVTGTFGADAIRVEEAELATDHEVLLVGIPALTDVTVEVRPEGGGAPATAPITTGALPSWVPDVKFEAAVPEAAEGGFTVTSAIQMESGGGVLIFDAAGRVVWAYERVDDLDGAVIRARLSQDGRAVLYNGGAPAVDSPGVVVRIPLDGEEPVVYEIDGTHTDFVELPGGGLAALGWELRDFDGRTILGNTIVELDADGRERVVWSVFDSYAPDPDGEFDIWYPADPTVPDWSHVNGLSYDPVEDDYYVTMTWNDGVARIDRGTGALVWNVADVDGTFANVGEGPLMTKPHSVQRTPDGLLVFSRGDPSKPETCSEAVDLRIDEELGTVERTWAYTSEVCLLVTFLGSAQRLPGGNTLVSFTNAGQLDEVTPEGEVAWRVNSTLGAGFGFAERVPTLGDGRP